MKPLAVCLFFVIVIITPSLCVDIECDYQEWVGWGYGCLVVDGDINTTDEAIVTSITGEHVGSKTNEDVVWISIESRIARYFPRQLAQFFPDLVNVRVAKSKMREIFESDFEGLEKIENLYLDSNSIESVSRRAFDNLTKLRTLTFDYNKCFSSAAHFNRVAVVKIIDDIKRKCSSGNEDVKEEEASTTTKTTEAFVESQAKEEHDDGCETLKAEKEQNLQLQKDIESLKTKLTKAEAQVNKFRMDNVRLKAELQLCDDSTTILTENTNLKSELTRRNKEMANLKAENANLTARVYKSETETAGFRFQVINLKSENSNLKIGISRCDTLMSNVTLENENLRMNNEKCDNQLSRTTNENEDLVSQINNFELKRLELLAQIENLNQGTSKCDNEISSVVNEKESVSSKLMNCELEKSNLQLKNGNENLSLQQAIAKCELDNSKFTSANENLAFKLENFETNLATLADENRKLLTDISVFESQMQFLQSIKEDHELCTQEKINFASEKEALISTLQQYDLHVSTLRNEVLKIQTMTSMCSTQLTNLQNENENLKTGVNNHDLDYTNLLFENENLQVHLDDCNSKIVSMNRDTEDIKMSLARYETAANKLLDENEHFKSRLMKCDSAVTTLMDESDDLTSKILKCDSEVTNLYADIWKLQNNKDYLRENLIKSESSLEKCSKNLIWCTHTYCGKYQTTH